LQRRRRAFDDAVDHDGGARSWSTAYLPNEQSIILDTIRHLQTAIDVLADRFQILLAYNTPCSIEIEVKLADVARQDPRGTL
jgi:hypothetical protein